MKPFPGWPLFLFLLIATVLPAQSNKIYTVQVGTFLEAKAADFDNIRSLGMIYGQRLENNLYRVFLGGFEKAEAAQRVAAEVRKRGYNSAAVVEIPIDDGKTVTVIQIETLNATRPVSWGKYAAFDNLFAIIHEDVVKLVVGPYASLDEARRDLDRVKKSGYADAFVKRVSTAFLQRITSFETGIKQPLIPLNLSAAPGREPAAPAQAFKTEAPRTAARGVETAAVSPAKPAALPNIRGNIKRASVIELQKALKAQNTYSGPIDGLYGNGTETAYQQALRNDRDLQKYRILSKSMVLPVNLGVDDALQAAIDDLPASPQAAPTLERSAHPLAKAYRAYLLFLQIGPATDVNALMNTAIRDAYTGKAGSTKAPFNYKATYAYNDLDQLLLHIFYLHLAPGVPYAVPCWVFQRHPQPAGQALQTAQTNGNGAALRLQSCDPFLDWEEGRMAIAIAIDLNDAGRLSSEPLARAAAERTRLYLTGAPLPAAEAQRLAAWNDSLWKGLNGWAGSDPLHQRLVDAFRVSFFQSQVRLEDFYMDKGFPSEHARSLALATLKTMVGPHTERFL